MLAAIITLLLVNLVIRGVIALVRRFLTWLGRGRELEGLVADDRIETEDERLLRQIAESRDRRAEAKLTREERATINRIRATARERYVGEMNLTWYHVVVIFLVGSFLGLIIEEVYCFVVNGVTESRVGLVWGPFSPLYGFGATFLTLFCWELRRRKAPWWAVFLTAMVVGGLLEQVTGWGMETLLHASSWDYTGYWGALSKWVCVPYLFFWGALGLIWDKLIMPALLFRIGMPSTVRQAVFVTLLALYLSADIFMTVACFARMEARDAGIPAQNAFEEWVDDHYTNAFIAGRFQNLVIGTDGQGDAS